MFSLSRICFHYLHLKSVLPLAFILSHVESMLSQKYLLNFPTLVLPHIKFLNVFKSFMDILLCPIYSSICVLCNVFLICGMVSLNSFICSCYIFLALLCYEL